jgi:hypothetical protein
MKHVMLTLNDMRSHYPSGSRLNNCKLSTLWPLVLSSGNGTLWCRMVTLSVWCGNRTSVTAVINRIFPSVTSLKQHTAQISAVFQIIY